MNRREYIICCTLTTAVAGCLEGSSSSGESNGNGSSNDTDQDSENDSSNGNDQEEENNTDDGNNQDSENGTSENESYYVIEAGGPVESAGEFEERCLFNNLSEGVQDEVERTIEEGDPVSETRTQYRTTETPEILDSDCYGQLIEYEGDYYDFGVMTPSVEGL